MSQVKTGYLTVTAAGVAQNLNLGFVPSKFTMRNDTIMSSGNGNAETMTGLIQVDWDEWLGGQSTPYTLTGTATDGAIVYSRLASGTVAATTGVVPFQSSDADLYTPQQAPYFNVAGTRAYIQKSTLQVIDNGALSITQAANALVTTSEPHSFTTAADVGVTVVQFHGVPGMVQINGLSGVIQSVPSTTTFTVNINTSNFTAYLNGQTEGVSSGFFNVITGAPANTIYGNVSLPTAEQNLGIVGLRLGTTIMVNTGDVWYYEATLNYPGIC